MAMRTWEEMRTSIAERLATQTGHDLACWNERISAEPGLDDEAVELFRRAYQASR
jgi:hypothetical protein